MLNSVSVEHLACQQRHLWGEEDVEAARARLKLFAGGTVAEELQRLRSALIYLVDPAQRAECQKAIAKLLVVEAVKSF